MANDEEYDVFDPIAEEGVKQLESVETAKSDLELASYIKARRSKYDEVFSEGETSQAAIDFVMKDLLGFCHIDTTPFHINPAVQNVYIGRGEVYHRILDFTRLRHDTLYLKYTDAKYKLEGSN